MSVMIINTLIVRSKGWKILFLTFKINCCYVLTLRRISKVTPPRWYGGGAWGWWKPPLCFHYVTIFRKDFIFSRKPVMRSPRWGTYYGLPRCWGACHVIQYGRHFGRHFRFYRKLEIVKIFCCFLLHFVHFSPKKDERGTWSSHYSSKMA